MSVVLLTNLLCFTQEAAPVAVCGSLLNPSSLPSAASPACRRASLVVASGPRGERCFLRGLRTDTGGTWIDTHKYPGTWTDGTCTVQGAGARVLGNITATGRNSQPVVKLDHDHPTIWGGSHHGDPGRDGGATSHQRQLWDGSLRQQGTRG